VKGPGPIPMGHAVVALTGLRSGTRCAGRPGTDQEGPNPGR
jgi:hypothetical protein